MKYCSNCHRFSKDDDFCTHCGSAVYDDNSENSIDCSQIPGHTHEKQTFSGSAENQKRTYQEPSVKKKGNGCVGNIFLIIIVFVLIDMIFGGIGNFFEILERLLG